LRDVIVTGGVNVFPGDVERQLLALPGVADAAVVGEPDPYWGEAVVAYLVPRGAFSPALARAALERQLGPAQRPKRLYLCRALPRTPTGKLLKRELRPDAPYIVGTASDSGSDAT
jgi:acyl-CoA synthetase (AMP-forming)/AMP-acid ligase II